MAESPVLVVLPRPPAPGDRSERFLRALASRGRPVRVIEAATTGNARLRRLGVAAADESADALAARLQDLCGRKTYLAVVIIEGPATTNVAARVADFARRPVVLARLEASRSLPPDAAFLTARRAKAEIGRNVGAAWEVWDFSGAPPEDLRSGRMRPRRVLRASGLSPAWIDARLKALVERRPSPFASERTSIIIPCWNNVAMTQECLEAVARHTPEAHEVIVVDNGSSDATASVARRRKARVIRNEVNLGFAAAINQGMRAAKGDWLVWLNNDVVVTPNWLTHLLAKPAEFSWIGAVGPRTNETVGAQKVGAVPYKNISGLPGFSQAWAMRHEGRVTGAHRLTGFCMAVRREAYRQVGELDLRFGLGTYEEFDYALRLRQAGWELAVSEECYVHHHGHRTFGSNEAMLERAAVNRDIFIDKWCGRALEFLDELNPFAERFTERGGRKYRG
jgi:GT2 family glycosyltransferase